MDTNRKTNRTAIMLQWPSPDDKFSPWPGICVTCTLFWVS